VPRFARVACASRFQFIDDSDLAGNNSLSAERMSRSANARVHDGPRRDRLEAARLALVRAFGGLAQVKSWAVLLDTSRPDITQLLVARSGASGLGGLVASTAGCRGGFGGVMYSPIRAHRGRQSGSHAVAGKIDPVRALWTASGSHHTDQFVPLAAGRTRFLPIL